jgi:hypothetical protein
VEEHPCGELHALTPYGRSLLRYEILHRVVFMLTVLQKMELCSSES